jgi:hypothetical protein
MSAFENINLTKIIRRLELIKSLISLEEEDEIASHVSKLEQVEITPELGKIIVYLKINPTVKQPFPLKHLLISTTDF